MPEFSISNHAREQIEFRNISLEVVMSILTNPQQILTEEGKKVYQSIINSVSCNNKATPKHYDTTNFV